MTFLVLKKVSDSDYRLFDTGAYRHAKLNRTTAEAISSSIGSEKPGNDNTTNRMVALLRQTNFTKSNESVILQQRTGPLNSVEFLLTSECNLRCRHCYLGTYQTKTIPLTVFEEVLREAASLGAYNISLSGGETLMVPNIASYIWKARGFGFRVEILTNATRCASLDYAKELKESGLLRAIVSLDGFADVHESLRGPGSYKRAVDGIRFLREAGVIVEINHLLTPANVARFEEFRTHCLSQLGAKRIHLMLTRYLGAAKGHPDLFFDKVELPVEIIKKYIASNIHENRSDEFPCGAARSDVLISSDGAVYPCVEYLDYPIGNIHDQSLSSILSSENKRLDKFRRFTTGKMVSCVSCPSFSECGGGCRAKAEKYSGNIYGIDPIKCWLHRDVVPDDMCRLF